MQANDMRRLLGEVAHELSTARATARVYIIGGAAMSLAYDVDRTTRDIDGVVLEGHGALMEAVRTVARRHGLPGSWLNEQAAAYLPPGADNRGILVFDHPNLRVIAASADRMLAMKAQAARATDLGDLRVLADRCMVDSLDAIVELCLRLMPDQPLSSRARAVLGELFEARGPSEQ